MVLQMVQVSEGEASRVMAFDEASFLEWLETGAGAEPEVDLDKAWHALHHVLTGTPWDTDGELGQLILGGEEFGEDLGYGASRWLPPGEVHRLSTALDALDPEDFAARIDLAAMVRDDVYPNVWDRAAEADELRSWLVESYTVTRAAFATAAAEGDGFIVSLL